MSSYHNKSIFINSSITSLVNYNGSKVSKPEFYYNDQTNITFTITDSKKNSVDLTGGTFEFKIAESYTSTPMINITSFTTTNIATGIVSCIADFNQPSILAYLDGVGQDNAYGSLWVTISGTRYCLASFICRLNNIIF
jgi:hypothetical protein